MIRFKFRLSGTDSYFKIESTDKCIFNPLNGIMYISLGLKEIVINEGFKPEEKNGYIEIIRSV